MHPGGSLVPAAGLGTRCSWSCSFLLVPTPFPPPGNQVGFSLPVGPLSWPADPVLGTQAQLSRASAGCWQTNAQLNLYPPVSARAPAQLRLSPSLLRPHRLCFHPREYRDYPTPLHALKPLTAIPHRTPLVSVHKNKLGSCPEEGDGNRGCRAEGTQTFLWTRPAPPT